MIDLHSHILPNIDDGAKSLNISIEMAKIAVEDGIKILACTPHIRPPTYSNNTDIIRKKVDELTSAFQSEGINLKLIMGADIHIAHDLIEKLDNQSAPTLNKTKYFLFEPPHHILPPNLIKFSKQIVAAGYIPILTHPERLTWIEKHYNIITQLDEMGVPIQLTAASITGRFGDRAQYWSKRFLKEGRVDLIASDAHDPKHRPPKMASARDIIADMLGDEAAKRLTLENPFRILKNQELPEKNRTATSNSSQISGVKSILSRFGF